MTVATNDRRRFVHHLVRAALLTGFALFIAHLVMQDNLGLYIAPRMATFVKLSALALYVTAIYQVYAALQAWNGQQAADCGCDHEPPSSITKNIIVYGLFILPLALGFVLPESTLGSSLAAKKGMTFGGAETLQASSGGQATLPAAAMDSSAGGANALFPYDEYTKSYAAYGKQLVQQPAIDVTDKWFIETLTTIDLYRSAFQGKTVTVSGFVYRDEAMGSEQFAVSRFAMNCCSADSLPYGLMVKSDQAAAFQKDTWVSVTGTVEEGSYDGGPILQLNVTRITPIAAPSSPYVYPDYNFDQQFDS
ncbi:TIGR03943 family putative permease subunit [Paenibacillus phyllosphaerae]|uniref:TIGR03943 family putative permease subunit n=1 Tax=Paenibacillus phyllosphaerae TaxID=274593 RepID=UPI0016210F09|nr:TIGR03943 family protein [Paenibacillus phyllosphaerae]